ncbi:MAG: hypothetical protein LIO54_08390 [Oscillospiraceae bacterium]|nr:hypothetical protein [Oscillospiraceae bacterium]
MRYSIYEENMERLSKKMTRIQNKCHKYGCDFHYEEVGEEYRELTDEDGNKYTARFVVIDAEGVAEINGWKFIAAVEHTSKGNIINAACDIEVPDRYYTSKPICEHCNCNRTRKDTYIVMNMETGEFKQVGKSCLKDFTHGMSAEAVAQYTAAFDSLIEAEAPVEGCRIQSYIKTEEYLRYVAETVRHFGYVKNEPGERSTASRAMDYYRCDNGMMRGKRSAEIWNEMQDVGFDAESEEAIATIEAAREWLNQQPENSNYMHNLKVATALDYSTFKNVGILASLLPTYNRELEYQAKVKKEAEAASKSEYVGTVGQRIEIEVASIACVTSWETQWGLTKILKIEDKAGNIFTWKTSSWIPDDVKSIKGTVKEHKEYRGAKQTELTRCKAIA